MVEYITLIGGNSNLMLSLQQFLGSLMDFFKTPEGWAFIAVVAVLFFVFRR